MARIETIKNVWGTKSKIINVDTSVGANAVNSPFDVVMVKALLAYSHLHPQVCEMTGLNIFEMPSPHDFTTYGMAITIKKFQKAIRSFPLFKNYSVTDDGRVSRAPGIAAKGRILYTIAVLNFLAALSAGLQGSIDHTEHIFQVYPHIGKNENGIVSQMFGL